MIVMYFVVSEGIYRHEILGIYDEFEDAKKEALNTISHQDHDGYHDAAVYCGQKNVPIDDIHYIGCYRKKHISRYGNDPYKEREIKWLPYS